MILELLSAAGHESAAMLDVAAQRSIALVLGVLPTRGEVEV